MNLKFLVFATIPGLNEFDNLSDHYFNFKRQKKESGVPPFSLVLKVNYLNIFRMSSFIKSMSGQSSWLNIRADLA